MELLASGAGMCWLISIDAARLIADSLFGIVSPQIAAHLLPANPDVTDYQKVGGGARVTRHGTLANERRCCISPEE